MNKNNPLYRCQRCKSKNVAEQFKIQHVLHEWFLCERCNSKFFDWVVKKKEFKMDFSGLGKALKALFYAIMIFFGVETAALIYFFIKWFYA